MPIDLNADVGEGLETADAAILPLITSANIACGGHAGDLRTMRATVALAVEHGVAIGAHPGYPDREGFGRRAIDISEEALRASLREQLETLAAVATEAGARIAHVKPHGSLYNQAAADPTVARLLAEVVRAWDPDVVLVGLAGSASLAAGREAGLAVAAEGFADRAYEPDGSLRPRSRAGAMHEDAAVVAAQAVAIARDGQAPLEGGGSVAVAAETLCLHGDEPGAVDNARAVRAALRAAGVTLVRGSRTTSPFPRVTDFGESALLVELGATIEPELNARVHALAQRLDSGVDGWSGLGRCVPAYASLLVPFETGRTDTSELTRGLLELANQVEERVADGGSLVEIPVMYGYDDGPDLDDVARLTGISADSVIDQHAATEYRVHMLGFAPGFAYLGPVPEALHVPRRAEPRVRVPAGSVAIAGAQTAVYPQATAGGWHLIGRTEATLWDPTADEPARLRPGDRVRFVPV